MTSEEYATAAAGVLSFVVTDWSPSAMRLRRMLVDRIGQGAGEYEVEPTVQGVEVKPLLSLVEDIREEAVDQVAYAVALWLRDPTVAGEVHNLVHLALLTMASADRIQASLEEG